MADSFGLLAVLFAVYFVPTVVALVRKHHHLAAILACNILFGWTLLGWGIALIWAVLPVRRPQPG